MEVILIKEVENLGHPDDLVTVKPGYARNYLIPQGMAVVANDSNRKILAEKEKQLQRKQEQLLSKINEIQDKLGNMVLRIGAKVGTTEKIFGSVSPHHISQAIKDQAGYDIDRRSIEIAEGEVKTLGTYTANIKLHPEHSVSLSFEVVAE
jgi:large subunit ribosomal protein L9